MTKAQSICLVNVSLAVMRHHKQIGEQRVSLAYTFTSSNLSLKEARAGQAGAEARQSAASWLTPQLAQLASSRDHHAMNSPHPLLLRKCLTARSYGGIFSTEVPPFKYL